VADKRCENGHFIDESWDLCPYCPVDSREPEIPVVRPSRFGSSDAAAPPPPPTQRPPAATQRPQTIPDPMRRAPANPPTNPVPRHDPMQVVPGRTVAVPKPVPGGGATPAEKRYVVGWLVGLNAATRGESFPVRLGRNVLGRDKRSDIVVNDDQASSHHADLVFRPEERRFILMDHNSTNGTYVNEVEIEPRRDLAQNDIVRIGIHRFLFMPLCQEGFYWDDEGLLQ
jgi:hypothetical protein